MAQQLSFTDGRKAHIAKVKHPKIPLAERFRLWAVANEPVIQLLLKYAREAKDAGMKHIGMRWIVERVRWEVYVTRRSADPWKINNSYVSFLARLLVERDPSLAPLFEFRKMRSRHVDPSSFVQKTIKENLEKRGEYGTTKNTIQNVGKVEYPD